MIRREPVECHHDRPTKARRIGDLGGQIATACRHVVGIGLEQGRVERFAGDDFVAAAVCFERADGGDEHDGVGRHARDT